MVSHGAATTVAAVRSSSAASNASLGVSAGFDRQVARMIRIEATAEAQRRGGKGPNIAEST
jgi:hypothetical protein